MLSWDVGTTEHSENIISSATSSSQRHKN